MTCARCGKLCIVYNGIFSATSQRHVHSIYVCDMIKQSTPLQTRYDTTYIYDRYYIRTHVYVFLLSVKNACLNYREFDLEGDLVGVPHTWHLSAQSFTRLLKLVWREYDIVAMNDWKKKCVGLPRTWVSKRTVTQSIHCSYKRFLHRWTTPFWTSCVP